MSFNLITGLTLFSIISSITPGPNNFMALTSGANHGYKKTLPLIVGVCIGFLLMLFLVAAGLGQLFKLFPITYIILKVACCAYICFLAFKIANTKKFQMQDNSNKPVSLLQSAMFQWINPKAWMATITIITTFTVPHNYMQSLIIGSVITLVIIFISVSTWALSGLIVRKWLSNPLRFKLFNWIMAILLVLSIIPALLSKS